MHFDEGAASGLRDHDPVGAPYLLPTGVISNIPRYPTAVGAEPSSLNHARGELMEACRFTNAQPIALLVSYVLLYDVSLATVIESRLLLPDGKHVRVDTEFRRYWDTHNEWSITVNGRAAGSPFHSVPPHPRMVGSIVRAALAATAGPDPSGQRASQHHAARPSGREIPRSRLRGPSAPFGGLG
ncbi:hypothetical protein [Pseudonocardia sp. GCM10023141]|uniref:hypothetical protein n=1 Tax=Pseudonocardia sp. GCM10023141 TaxID=3252653 RepID=UPI0036209962